MTGPFADLTDLRLLAAVSKHRSVSAAALSVRISQPAASRRLHAIQTRVGMQLFQFGPRGATLTEAGQFWSGEALKVLSGLDDAQSRFATAFHLRNGLYFAASQVVAEYLVPRWLSGWPQTRHSTASIVVGNSEEVVSLAASKMAVAGGMGPAIVPRIAVEDDLRAGRLREIPIADLELEVWVTAIWLPATELSAVARSFIDHLRSARTLSMPA